MQAIRISVSVIDLHHNILVKFVEIQVFFEGVYGDALHEWGQLITALFTAEVFLILLVFYIRWCIHSGLLEDMIIGWLAPWLLSDEQVDINVVEIANLQFLLLLLLVLMQSLVGLMTNVFHA